MRIGRRRGFVWNRGHCPMIWMRTKGSCSVRICLGEMAAAFSFACGDSRRPHVCPLPGRADPLEARSDRFLEVSRGLLFLFSSLPNGTPFFDPHVPDEAASDGPADGGEL